MAEFAGDRASPRDVVADHVALEALLGSLAEVVSAREAVPLLESVAELQPAHFAAEEEPGGYFAQLVEMAPGNHRPVQMLRSQHSALLRAVADALNSITREDCGSLHDLHQLAHTCMEHEKMETELMIHTLYIDLGGRG